MSLGRVGHRRVRWADGGPDTIAGLVLGLALDRVLGDPQRLHPVAGFGRAAGALERLTYRDSRWAGALFWVVAVGAPVAATAALDRAARTVPFARAGLTAATVWAATGGTTLARVGVDLADDLEDPDLTAARRRLPMLCGRLPDQLDRPALARAGIESVAENTADAAVGVVVWGAILGAPGVVAYRAVNTLDAMVGHRSERYGRFGWAAARADDVLGYPAARLTGVLAALRARVVGGSGAAALRVWRADAAAHPSPNAGVCEAAWAGALDISLGGPTPYRYGTQLRPVLGAGGRDPGPDDVRRAATLSLRVQEAAVLAAAVALGAVYGVRRIQRRRP
ncbi:cobalamin biosynthesis protein [Millisia brevis]|uniref:cobalamin biosynthesis protein n=1 Tax=Millisia brevis TaxID=264148 RepID=UPI0009FD505D|nr:cobalamin biosynthesis protein [Millisia brevis]